MSSLVRATFIKAADYTVVKWTNKTRYRVNHKSLYDQFYSWASRKVWSKNNSENRIPYVLLFIGLSVLLGWVSHMGLLKFYLMVNGSRVFIDISGNCILEQGYKLRHGGVPSMARPHNWVLEKNNLHVHCTCFCIWIHDN